MWKSSWEVFDLLYRLVDVTTVGIDYNRRGSEIRHNSKADREASCHSFIQSGQ